MFDQRRSPRKDTASPISFRIANLEVDGELVNISGTGALVRFPARIPVGPDSVGQPVTLTAWYDVGALVRPRATAVRFFEDIDGKHLAVKYLPD